MHRASSRNGEHRVLFACLELERKKVQVGLIKS